MARLGTRSSTRSRQPDLLEPGMLPRGRTTSSPLPRGTAPSMRRHYQGHSIGKFLWSSPPAPPRAFRRCKTCVMSPRQRCSDDTPVLERERSTCGEGRRRGPYPIGNFNPCSRAQAFAISYPASACRITPVPGSFHSTRAMRLSAASVPSQTITMPLCCE